MKEREARQEQEGVSLWSLASDLDYHLINTDCTKTVLQEAMNYFETPDSRNFLPYYAERIYNLLLTISTFLSIEEKKLKRVRDVLYAKSKKENQERRTVK